MVMLVSILLTSCGAKPAIIQMKETNEQPSATPPEVVLGPDGSDQAESPEAIGTSPAKIFVHVCGAVNQPGVYEMIEGNRVFEAIELAAGFTAEAHQQSINLANKVTDGLQVIVPTKEEVAQMPKPATLDGQSEQSLININTADTVGLQTLSGIGAAKAKEILAYREANGAFNSIEDIKDVSGIGEKLYEKIKENITVD